MIWGWIAARTIEPEQIRKHQKMFLLTEGALIGKAIQVLATARMAESLLLWAAAAPYSLMDELQRELGTKQIASHADRAEITRQAAAMYL